MSRSCLLAKQAGGCGSVFGCGALRCHLHAAIGGYTRRATRTHLPIRRRAGPGGLIDQPDGFESVPIRDSGLLHPLERCAHEIVAVPQELQTAEETRRSPNRCFVDAAHLPAVGWQQKVRIL